MRLLLILLMSMCLMSLRCKKQQSFFYEDDNDPGLTRLTDRDYQIASAYVNGSPWVQYINENGGGFGFNGTYWNNFVTLTPGTNDKDTLNITWSGEFSRGLPAQGYTGEQFKFMTLSFPVDTGYAVNKIPDLEGERFPTPLTPVYISFGNELVPDLNSIRGSAKLYFIQADTTNGGSAFRFTGLFEGKIGDSVLITKGRFDNGYFGSYHNLPY